MNQPTIEQQEEQMHAHYAQQIRIIKNCGPAINELIDLNARRLKYKYDALIKVGFTKEQAMELIKGDA